MTWLAIATNPDIRVAVLSPSTCHACWRHTMRALAVVIFAASIFALHATADADPRRTWRHDYDYGNDYGRDRDSGRDRDYSYGRDRDRNHDYSDNDNGRDYDYDYYYKRYQAEIECRRRAKAEDPTGQFRRYPCWAREAFGRN